MVKRAWLGIAVGLALALALSGAMSACGSEGGNSSSSSSGTGATTSSGTAGAGGSSSGAGGDLFDAGTGDASAYDLTPQDPVLTVVSGQALPTVQFQVTQGGNVVPALWLCSRGEIGVIDSDGIFTPTGTVGGQATIEATVGQQKLTTTVTVNLEIVQNGSDGNDPPPGSGGWGGVGGEGVGPAVDPGLLALLQGATSPDPSLAWLYPYDQTVWPLGLLPPLLQWSAGVSQVADAVYIHLYSAHYDYKGYFARPAPLAPGAAFVRHPIPAAAWQAATFSSAGATLNAEIVVAAGGVAYGAISESWTIGRGLLKGTVYYQSYGTNLATNYCCYQNTSQLFGGATLAIQPGANEPELVAGTSGGTPQCRVCHSVSANGSRMVVQHGDAYAASSSYDLQNAYAETPYAGSGNLGWVGMSPDGDKGIGNRVPIPGGANPNSGPSELYDMTSGAVIPSTGLTDLIARAGFPSFSVDGQHVAFNFYSGPGDGNIGTGDGTKLVAMDFDGASNTFSGARLLYQGANPPGWPSFLPTNDAVVFQVQLPGGGEYFATRNGAKGELWWADLATGTAAPLERLNGKVGGQLIIPTGANNHGDDSELGYEPTVSPIPSGGYAWIVFTSRRMYGNVATIDPWRSDPRYHDILTNVTPKKLWVAAVDLNAAPGTDPSHPAFYLPGQELMAGNARGYWVNVPCKPDGEPCSTGDECCGGFCQIDPNTNELVCGQQGNECSNEFESCDTAADCCDPFMECLNGMCAQSIPG